VRILLDSGSDGDLIFVDKDKSMLLPSLKRLVPQSWNTLNGRFQTTQKAEIELNFFEYFDSKRYLVAPGRNMFGNLVWGNRTENTARHVSSQQL
jgi:hypothetical protein